MKNEFIISNLNEIYKGDFVDMVTMKNLEAIDLFQYKKLFDSFGDILQKSEENELSTEDKNQMDLIKAEIKSYKKWEVLDNNFQKHIMFTRPKK